MLLSQSKSLSFAQEKPTLSNEALSDFQKETVRILCISMKAVSASYKEKDMTFFLFFGVNLAVLLFAWVHDLSRI